MPASVDLRENDQVLYYEFISPLTLAELSEVVKESERHLDKSDKTLHVVINATQLRDLPPGVLRYSSAVTLRHPRNGHIAISGKSNLIRTVVEVLLRIARYDKVKFFDTEEAAWDYIKKVATIEV